VPLREEVELHLTPNTAKQVMDIRIWWSHKMVHSVSLPLAGLRVHFSTLANSSVLMGIPQQVHTA
jgi:hypothetical protein